MKCEKATARDGHLGGPQATPKAAAQRPPGLRGAFSLSCYSAYVLRDTYICPLDGLSPRMARRKSAEYSDTRKGLYHASELTAPRRFVLALLCGFQGPNYAAKLPGTGTDWVYRET